MCVLSHLCRRASERLPCLLPGSTLPDTVAGIGAAVSGTWALLS